MRAIKGSLKNAFIRNIRRTIAEYSMIPEGTGLVAAVSGGPDSVAMLHALVLLSKDECFRIIVAHFDHALRPESSGEEFFVSKLAHKLGLEYRTERGCVREYALSQKISIEEAGRLLRYDFLERIRNEFGVPVIAVGHHVDDQLETFFLRFFKGASLEGLCGIPPVRGNIVRPLIRVNRKQILMFLQQENISYVIDSSNLEVGTERNFIRNVVFPLIKERFESFQDSGHRTIEVLRDENQVMEDMAQQLYRASVTTQEQGLHLDRKKLLQSPTAVCRRVVMKTLYSLAGPRSRFGQSHLHLIEQLLVQKRPSGSVQLPHSIQARRTYDSICFCKGKRAFQRQPYELKINSPCIIDVPHVSVQLRFETSSLRNCGIDFKKPSVAYFDAELLSFPLFVRTPKPGDRMRPWGFPGSRKIKKILIDAKVPQHVRPLFPLVVKDNEIVWIPLIRRSGAAPVSPHTRAVLKVSIIGKADVVFRQPVTSISSSDA